MFTRISIRILVYIGGPIPVTTTRPTPAQPGLQATVAPLRLFITFLNLLLFPHRILMGGYYVILLLHILSTIVLYRGSNTFNLEFKEKNILSSGVDWIYNLLRHKDLDDEKEVQVIRSVSSGIKENTKKIKRKDSINQKCPAILTPWIYVVNKRENNITLSPIYPQTLLSKGLRELHSYTVQTFIRSRFSFWHALTSWHFSSPSTRGTVSSEPPRPPDWMAPQTGDRPLTGMIPDKRVDQIGSWLIQWVV
jgi:hypothetical protein